jgi:hypothetical protein
MNQIDRELAQAIRNLSALSQKAVPAASSMAVNRVAKRAVSHSVKSTAKEVKVTQKLIRERTKIRRASAKMPVAYLQVRGHALPAIAIGSARTQIRRRKGKMMISAAVRNKKGRFKKRDNAGFTSIRVGRHKFENAFLQKAPHSGKWHIFQRVTDARYPIKVCKIPIGKPMQTHFNNHSKKLMKTDMPKELKAAMAQQVRLHIRREVGHGR